MKIAREVWLPIFIKAVIPSFLTAVGTLIAAVNAEWFLALCRGS